MKKLLVFFMVSYLLVFPVFAVEDPVTEAPVEEPVTETPVEEPVPEAPAEEPVTEIPVEEPVTETPVEEPVTETPVEKPVTETPVEEPVTETPVDELVTDTPVEEPVSSGGGGGDVINEITEIYVMPSDIPVDATITDISVMSLAPITPSDASGLKAVLLEVIGDYDPVIIEYAYENYNGSTAYLREVQPDYVWQGSLLLFGLIIYCLFRLGGALIRD